MITKKVAKLQKELNELIKYSPNSTLIEDLKKEIELELKRVLESKKYWNEYLTKTNRKQVKMSTGKLIRLYYDIILHIIMITITGIILMGGIFIIRLGINFITN